MLTAKKLLGVIRMPWLEVEGDSGRDLLLSSSAEGWVGPDPIPNRAISSEPEIRGPLGNGSSLRVVANSPEFATAFQCAEGSPMRPAEQCRVW